MGNIPGGVPPLLAKNWQPVPQQPNSFRNKLTFQYVHKHIINVQEAKQIESFKARMKQTDPYFCRVLFYHQYHDTIYHVYTDQTHLQPLLNTQQSRAIKIKIVQSFAKIAVTYGFMKVCRQMIGADSNGHPKIWIHPDPVSYKPWSTCKSEAMMLSDILLILQNFQQKLSSRKQMNKSIMSTTPQEYTTFEQYIRIESQKMSQQSSMGGNKLNRTSAFLDSKLLNANQNVYIDKNLQIGSLKSHGGLNNSGALNSGGNFGNQIVPRKPRFSTENNKTSKLNKLFNPTICETSRDQESDGSRVVHGIYEQKHIKINQQKYSISNNQSLQAQPNKYVDESSRENPINRRRDSQNFRLKYNLNESSSTMSRDTPVTVQSMLGVMQNAYQQPRNSSRMKKNPLVKLISGQTYQKIGEKIRENKSSFGFSQYQNKQYSTKKTNLSKTQYPRKQHKFINVPNFLIKSNMELSDYKENGNQAEDRYHPETDRNHTNQIQISKDHEKPVPQLNLQLRLPEEVVVRTRRNTAAILKQELQNILESPVHTHQEINFEQQEIESDQLPRSKTENYQTKKVAQGSYFLDESNNLDSDKEELNMIKEKVEEKKARFAQLKNAARKILDDDF